MLMMRDVDNRFISQLRPVLKSAGLVAINHMYRSIPVGWGHERLGIMCKDNMIKAFEAFKPKMLLSLGISEAEYEPIAKQAAEEMNGKCQGYMNVEVYWGRKPTFKL
ncbi:hypothetical protein BC938DRAFT_480027 [Jimgerdemannia flammicorona]|uniref:Uncharacterized protein n=1 Tax=Jimgerdemannia flammicorona TaxID=994334 RepID=A0A433QJJ8_9FUNG|nr:hypothetical protein BC938DRAFT_480027 [Jimgerdemannia flammicorona]